jgi:arylamine N-acetyltransferase
MRPATARLLAHLGLEREPPTLAFLHRLIQAHQTRVPFETLTKLADYEPGLARGGEFLPTLDLYVDRMITRGGGGLCWTLARGFHALLTDLGFDASHMYMDPGHLCVRVELPEGPQYADVGYAAPILQAYPLFESFTVASHREQFTYEVGAQGILVTRNPGPTKTLDPTPRKLEEFADRIRRANDPDVPTSFLRRLTYSRFVDSVWTSLRDGALHRFRPEGLEKTEVAPAEAPSVLAAVFGADPELWAGAERQLDRLPPLPPEIG